jgi:hypothetical protein
MKYLKSFGMFWWDFIVGDDWRLAVGVVAGLGITWLLAHDDVTAWWVLPLVVAITLTWSLRRATR